MEPTLSQGVGYGIILGLGAFFAIAMNLVTYLQNRFSKHKTTQADEFTAASRNLPFGLMVVSIVSSWTWSLTLLQSATEAYNFGVSGGYWYAVGGIIQLSMFSIIASKVKANANLVTTFPEMGYFRFGTAGHLAFLWCGFVCNAIVSSCILLGGGAVTSAITGMSMYASLFLIPFVCAVYVYFGGLRATFISDASHTFILLIFLIIFALCFYGGGSEKIGSPGKMWELLTELGHKEPVADNYHGSYLTFRSKSGGIFSFISVITGFGLVALDQAYWSRAIASNPLKTSAAYFTGSCAWFVTPLAMGLIFGLGARACTLFSDFPSLSDSEVSAGLASVAAASYVLGTAGSVMILLMVFLSVTSSFSGELIAASTLLSYDVYKKYFDKKASPKRVLVASQISVFIWAIFAGALASAFHAAGISMGWLFNFLGCVTASGVFPVTLTFTWKKLNKVGAVSGSVLGMLLAVTAWLIMCKRYMGEITVENLSNQWVSFTGNATALFLGGIFSIVFSLIKPDNFDWEKTRNRTILTDNGSDASYDGASAAARGEVIAGENSDSVDNSSEKKKEGLNSHLIDEEERSVQDVPEEEDIPLAELERKFKKYVTLCLLLAFIISIVIPVPQAAAPYIYSKGFFTFAVAAMIIWLFCTFFVCIVLPLWEARKLIWSIVLDLFGAHKKIPVE